MHAQRTIQFEDPVVERALRIRNMIKIHFNTCDCNNDAKRSLTFDFSFKTFFTPNQSPRRVISSIFTRLRHIHKEFS